MRLPKLTASRKSAGFTIVELLIVIVVIGILAAITIVAFNGVSNRAKVASMQSDLTSAVKTLALAKVAGGQENYPATATAANLKSSNGTVLEYNVDNASAPRNYCLTATNGAVIYSVSSLQTAPKLGSCIINLETNPSFETDTSNWSTGPNATLQRWTGQLNSGAYALLVTHNNGAAAGNAYVASRIDGLTIGTRYTVSSWLRATGTGTPTMNYMVQNGGVGGSMASGSSITVINNLSATYQRYGLTFVADASTVHIVFDFYNAGANESFTLDGVMVYPTAATTAYADGGTANWGWTGTPHQSISIGTAL